jgi:hypothetical protein
MVALMATVTVRWPPSARVYLWRRWNCFWLRQHNLNTEQSQTLCTQPFLSHLLRAQSGRAGLQNHRPQSDTCTGVRAIKFLGERTRDCSLHPLDQRWSSSSSSAPFEGLHCVHLPASTVYDYIKHTHEMPRVNGATYALSISPSIGYSLFFVFVHILLLFTAYVSSDIHMHIHIVTYITVIF